MKQHQKHNLNSNYADGMRDYKGKAGSQSDLRIGQADLLLMNFKTISGMPVITSMMIISWNLIHMSCANADIVSHLQPIIDHWYTSQARARSTKRYLKRNQWQTQVGVGRSSKAVLLQTVRVAIISVSLITTQASKPVLMIMVRPGIVSRHFKSQVIRIRYPSRSLMTVIRRLRRNFQILKLPEGKRA